MERLPAWARTVRMRLAFTYSALLFVISAVLVTGVYLAVSNTIDARPLESRTVEKVVKKDGEYVLKEGEQFEAADIDSIQKAVNQGTLDTLRNYSGIALAVLFLISLGVGWWVSGRVLRPIGAITATAREISASDLSRRIGATGPHDELRTLADTIDDMLRRLEDSFAAQRHLVDEVSHQLRNPVAVVRTNVDAVLANEHATLEQRRQAAAVVSRATVRMGRMIEDLLATARQRSGAFEEVEVDLSVLARHAVEEYRLAADGPGSASTCGWRAGRSCSPTRTRWRGRWTTCCPTPCGSRPRQHADCRGGQPWRVGVAGRARRGAGDRAGGPGPRLRPLLQQHRARPRGLRPQRLGHRAGDRAPDRRGARRPAGAHEPVGVGSSFVIWVPDRSPAGAGDRDASAPYDDPLGRIQPRRDLSSAAAPHTGQRAKRWAVKYFIELSLTFS